MCQKLCRLYTAFTACADGVGAAILKLVIRIYMAQIFLVSGLAKYADMATTVDLFRYEYSVPVLPPVLAAYLATAGELVLPVLLVLGLGGRFAALGLLVMTAMIEVSYTSHPDHKVWAMLLGVIFLTGPGLLSADTWIAKKVRRHD